MEPTDLSIKVLQEIRDENRGMRSDLSGVRADLGALGAYLNGRFDTAEQRFLTVDTTLRELVELLVMLARGLETAPSARSTTDRRLDDYEQRLRALEERGPH